MPNSRLHPPRRTVSVSAAFMSLPFTPRRTLACAFALTAIAHAQAAAPPEAFAALRLGPNWQVAGGLAGDPRHDKTLTPAPGTGILVCNPTKAAHAHLFTTWTHGDLALDLDFLMATGSNSGVYLQGRYEVQLYDSWGVQTPGFIDCGGIYERWDDSRPKGQKGYEGIAPRTNACLAPGLWQHLHIEFEAPRFDAAGKKTRNARFPKVVLNGITIHENAEVTGPTRSAAFNDEQPLGPLMIQGDHGPVAIRALSVTPRGGKPKP